MDEAKLRKMKDLTGSLKKLATALSKRDGVKDPVGLAVWIGNQKGGEKSPGNAAALAKEGVQQESGDREDAHDALVRELAQAKTLLRQADQALEALDKLRGGMEKPSEHPPTRYALKALDSARAAIAKFLR